MKIHPLLLASVVLAGLVLPIQALQAKDKPTKGEIALLYDRNLEGKNQNQQNQHNQMSDFFEADMVKRLTKAGYSPVKISSRDQFQPGPGRTLLTIKTVNYNPGSQAARILVGMGAGVCSLDIRYEVFGEDPEPIVAKDHGRGSSRDWRNCCQVLNKDIIEALQACGR